MNLHFKRISIVFIIILLLVVLVFVYRILTRNIIEAQILEITVEKVDKHLNYAMDEKLKESVLNNLDGYCYIVYKIKGKNVSNKITTTDIYIEPIFSSKMKLNVVWFDGTDAVTESQMSLKPQKDKNFYRQILIKKNGYSEDELISLAKRDKFRLKYYTFSNQSITSIGYNSSIANY